MIAPNPNYRGQFPFPSPRPDSITGRGGLDADRFFEDPKNRSLALPERQPLDGSLFRDFQAKWWVHSA
jgi:hypothetical protein